MDNAQEGRKSKRRVISTTEKRCIWDSLHGRVLRIDDFSGDRESRNNFTSGMGEQTGCSSSPSRTERRIRDSYIPCPERILVAVTDVFAPPWNKMIHSAKPGLKRPPYSTPKNARRVLLLRFTLAPFCRKEPLSCNYASVFSLIYRNFSFVHFVFFPRIIKIQTIGIDNKIYKYTQVYLWLMRLFKKF